MRLVLLGTVFCDCWSWCFRWLLARYWIDDVGNFDVLVVVEVDEGILEVGLSSSFWYKLVSCDFSFLIYLFLFLILCAVWSFEFVAGFAGNPVSVMVETVVAELYI